MPMSTNPPFKWEIWTWLSGMELRWDAKSVCIIQWVMLSSRAHQTLNLRKKDRSGISNFAIMVTYLRPKAASQWKGPAVLQDCRNPLVLARHWWFIRQYQNYTIQLSIGVAMKIWILTLEDHLSSHQFSKCPESNDLALVTKSNHTET